LDHRIDKSSLTDAGSVASAGPAAACARGVVNRFTAWKQGRQQANRAELQQL
jgi:hypothetical protein